MYLQKRIDHRQTDRATDCVAKSALQYLFIYSIWIQLEKTKHHRPKKTSKCPPGLSQAWSVSIWTGSASAHSFLCQHYSATKSHIHQWMDSMCVTQKIMKIKKVTMKEAEISCVLMCVSHAEGFYCGCWGEISFTISSTGGSTADWRVKWSAAMLYCSPLSAVFSKHPPDDYSLCLPT